MDMDLEDIKQQFLEIFYDNIERDGSEELLNYLEKTDFFTFVPRNFRVARILRRDSFRNVWDGNVIRHGRSGCRHYGGGDRVRA